jgi:hypothetical protein
MSRDKVGDTLARTGIGTSVVVILTAVSLLGFRACVEVSEPQPSQQKMCNEVCQEWHERQDQRRWDDRVDRDR